ncbi:hypothetical protein KR026_000793, partial [Drosophila bipectinata]
SNLAINNTGACPNAPLPPIVVAPVTPPPCPNAPLPPTVVAPVTPPPCPNAPLQPTIVSPAAPPLQHAPFVPPYNPMCITNCQTVCTGAIPCFSNCPSNCPPSYPSPCPNNCPSNCPNTCGNNNCNNNNNCNGNNNCNNNCQNATPPTVAPPTNPTNPTPNPIYPNPSPPPTPCPINPTPPSNPIYPTPPSNPINPTPPSTPVYPTPPSNPPPVETPSPTPPAYPPPTPPTEPPTYAPPAITRCPDGTILIRGKCRLIYCGGYGVYKDGQCVRPQCPAGYVWTENRCSKPQPTELGTIHLTSTIYQQGDDHPKLVTNNVNNLKVNASIAIPGQTSEEELEVVVEVPPSPQPPAGPCCNVVTPRICSTPVDESGGGYKCYSRSHQQCGSFCSASRVVLAPAVVTTWQMSNAQLIAMPPTWAAQRCQFPGAPCQQPQSKNESFVLNIRSYNLVSFADYHDCSGCAAGDFATCSSYCYSYKCPSHNCVYYDQAQFCAQYPDKIGCRTEDGWGL